MNNGIQISAFDRAYQDASAELIIKGLGEQVGEETSEINAGESVLWPKHVLHQLWTDGQKMVTQMIEHVHQVDDPAKSWQNTKTENRLVD